MTRSAIRYGIPFLGGALVSLVMAACSSDDSGGKGGNENKAGAGNDGDDAGSAGGAGSGGKAAAGGANNGGAASGGAPTGDLYTCFARQGMVPEGGLPNGGGDQAKGTDCCEGLGKCTDVADLASDSSSSSYGHDKCKSSDNLVCAPKPTDQLGLPDGGAIPHCTATYGTLVLEGRCLPDCFTAGNPLAAQIVKGTCVDVAGFPPLKCAPCYSPVDGASTGACERPLPGDAGKDAPEDPVQKFAECGSFTGGPKMGICVPEALVAQVADPALVPQDTCAAGEKCAPTKKVADQTSCFKKCSAMIGGEGACTPSYIVESVMAGVVPVLGKQTCDEGETCTPCLNPTAPDMAPTGACQN